MDTNGNIIYAVDFDKTLSMGKWPEVGEPNYELIQFLKDKKAAGARIILNTYRCGEALENAKKFCHDYGLIFDAINDNLQELKESYGEDCRKISADYYIDDRAITPDDILNKNDEEVDLMIADCGAYICDTICSKIKRLSQEEAEEICSTCKVNQFLNDIAKKSRTTRQQAD